jgi:hypothetical protein
MGLGRILVVDDEADDRQDGPDQSWLRRGRGGGY